mgnify:CR=1 FL=1
MATNLYLIGTVHTDLDGKERLDALLGRLAPAIVALEFHKDRENLESLRKSPEEEQKEFDEMIEESGLSLNPRQRAALLESGYRISDASGYEYKSSRDYTQRNPGSRLEYIDISVFANGKEEFAKGYSDAGKANFKHIAQTPELAKPLLETLDRGIDAYLENFRRGIQQIYRNAEEIALLFEILQDPKEFERMKQEMPPHVVQALEQIYNPRRDEAMGARVRELYDGKSRLVAIVGLGHLEALNLKVRDLEPRVMTLAEYDSV